MTDFDLGEIKFGTEPPINLNKNKEDPKPKAPRNTRSTTVRGPGRPSKNSTVNELKEDVTGFLMIAAMPLKMRDVHEDGTSCADLFVDFDKMKLTPEAENWAQSFAVVGSENKYIKAFFNMGEKTGAWMGLFFASQPFIMGIGAHHKVGRKHDATVEDYSVA